jgi:hypothetical protein
MKRCGVPACAKGLRWETAGGDDFHSSRSKCRRIQKGSAHLMARRVRQDLYQRPIVIWVNKNNLHGNVSFAESLLMSHECGCARYPAVPSPIPSSASFG